MNVHLDILEPKPTSRSDRSLWYRTIRTLALVFALVCAAINLSVAIDYIRAGMPKRDFTAFYTAGMVIRHGEGPKLYDLDVQRDAQNTLGLGGEFLPFLNPPHVAPLFIVLAAAPYQTVSRLWAIVQIILLALLMVSVWRFAARWTVSERLLATTTIASSAFVGYALTNGSLSILIALALFRWYANLITGQEKRAGAWLAVATLKPQAMLLPVASVLRRHYVIATFVMLCLISAIIAAVVLGLRSYLDYLTMTRTVQRGALAYFLSAQNMTNLKSMLVLSGMGHSRALLVSGAVLLLTFAFMVLWFLRASLSPSRIAFVVTLGLFLAPHANSHDLVALALPGMLIYDRARGTGFQWFAWSAIGLSLLINLAYLRGHLFLFLRLPQLYIVMFVAFAAFNVAKERFSERPSSGLSHASLYRHT